MNKVVKIVLQGLSLLLSLTPLCLTPLMLFAQSPIEVTASFSPSYRYVELSDYAKIHLFLQEKGDLNFSLGPMGRFVKLSPEDAKRIGHEHIVLILVNDMEGLDLSLNDDFDGKALKLRIRRLGNDSQVYYTQDAAYFIDQLRKDYPREEIPFTNKELELDDPLWACLSDPAFSDTLERSQLYSYGRLRYTRQFIELLDSDREVMMHSVSHFHYTQPDGGESVDYEDSYEPLKLADLARYRLGKIHNQVNKLPTPDENAPKAAWQAWYAKWFGENSPAREGNLLHEGNPLLRLPVMEKEIGNVRYGLRFFTGAEGTSSYDFKTQTRIRSSAKQFASFKIGEPRIEIGSDPLGGYISNDSAYWVGTPYRKDEQGNSYHRLLWGGFSVREDGFAAGPEYLNDAAHKLLRKHVRLDNYLDFKRVIPSEEVMYIHLRGRKSPGESDPGYYLLALETKTGKPLQMLEINAALREAGLAETDPYFLGMATVDETGNLVFCARVEGKTDTYLLKFDRNLKLLAHAVFSGMPGRIFVHKGNYRLVQLREQSLEMLAVDSNLVFLHSKRFELPGQQFDRNGSAICQLPDGRLAAVAKNALTLQEEIALVLAEPSTGASTVHAIDQKIRMEDAEAQYAHIVGLKYLDGYLYPIWIRNKRLKAVAVHVPQIEPVSRKPIGDTLSQAGLESSVQQQLLSLFVRDGGGWSTVTHPNVLAQLLDHYLSGPGSRDEKQDLLNRLLCRAILISDPGIVELLIARGANPRERDLWEALQHITPDFFPTYETMRLLEDELDVDLYRMWRVTPLWWLVLERSAHPERHDPQVLAEEMRKRRDDAGKVCNVETGAGYLLDPEIFPSGLNAWELAEQYGDEAVLAYRE